MAGADEVFFSAVTPWELGIDRMLIAQAQIEALAVVTADRSFQPYDVNIIDAGS